MSGIKENGNILEINFEKPRELQITAGALYVFMGHGGVAEGNHHVVRNVKSIKIHVKRAPFEAMPLIISAEIKFANGGRGYISGISQIKTKIPFIQKTIDKFIEKHKESARDSKTNIIRSIASWISKR